MKISDKKKEKISEQIVAFLYTQSPKPFFTVEIAREMARDEEFVKKLLTGLKAKNLVAEIRKNPKGKDYTKRSRWKISDAAYTAYKSHQVENQ